MTDPIRAALERLHQYAETFPEHDTDSIVARARAELLADGPAVPDGREPASVVGEPSDEGLMELMPQQFRDDLATVSRLASYGTPVEPGIYRVSLNTGALAFARAVLARYGHHPAPPAEGEVSDEELDDIADETPWRGSPRHFGREVARAAIALDRSRRAPVPVSERLPGPEDCALWPGEPDETPWCWVFTKGPVDDDSWERRPFTCLTSNQLMHSHWLPAHALPLPAGEGE